MQHQYPAQPDNTRHFSRQGRPYAWVSRWTLARPYLHFVTSLVRNNGLFTRKIPFRTAPPPYIGVCPEYENVSGIGTWLVRNNGLFTRKIPFRTAPASLCHEFAVGTHDSTNL